ncbi:MAG: hypothetical protein U0Z44_16565 [Kouleothrix sp.]
MPPNPDHLQHNAHGSGSAIGRARCARTMLIDRMPAVQIGIFEDAIYLTRRQGRG